MNKNEEQIYNKIVGTNKEYRNGTPIMSDFAYDTLVDELRSINPDHEWFQHIEPGMDVSDGRKVTLPFPMRSLDKAKTIKELMDWVKKVGLSNNDTVAITPKYDGISLLCRERDKMTYSRGGSENEGLNCQAHMMTMNRVEHNWDNFSYTFGEAIISRDNWMNHFEGRINPQTGTPYKSARNTVSGLFRRDVPSELLRFVDFIRYGWFDYCGCKTYYKAILQMKEDFERFGYTKNVTDISFLTINQLTEDNLRREFKEASRKYNIDGLVLYVEDIERWESIGRHPSTGNPQWAIAYKPEEFTPVEITKVKHIDCKVSKNGYLRPTVAIEEVELEGATISNPTGYNARFCFDNGIGADAEIKVIRSGMVIPKICGVVKRAHPQIIETAFNICPSCCKKTIWNETGTDRMCPDLLCPGRLLAKLVYFCEKMEYDDIGEETLRTIFNAGIETPGQLLQTDLSDLQNIDGIGYDTASKIIEKNRTIFDDGVSLPKLMEVSDCFEGIGEKKAILMLSNIDNETLQMWIKRELNTTGLLVIINQLKSTKGVGNKTIEEFLKHEREFVLWVSENKIPIDWEEEETGSQLAGKKICFTGIRDRELEECIKKAGGEVTNSVSKNTTWLIVDDVNSSSGKAIKARSLGIPVVTIDGFKIQTGL